MGPSLRGESSWLVLGSRGWSVHVVSMTARRGLRAEWRRCTDDHRRVGSEVWSSAMVVRKAGEGDRTLDIQLGKLTNSPVSSLSGAKRSGSEIAQNQNDSHLATTDKDSDPLLT